MLFVPIIWASFGFRPCKKEIEKHPCKFFFVLKRPLTLHFANMTWFLPRGS